MPAPIFIRCRRRDTAGHARRLLDRLLQWWDADAVFFDTHTVEAGEAFPDVLEQTVDAARLVLVVIGPTWEIEFAEREKRRDVDWVRREVARALARLAAGQALTVLPVLMSRTDARVRQRLCGLAGAVRAVAAAHPDAGRHPGRPLPAASRQAETVWSRRTGHGPALPRPRGQARPVACDADRARPRRRDREPRDAARHGRHRQDATGAELLLRLPACL
ncbi:MAG: TIR domain-containing protein [Proteobacteria bacterium]|nr:TIR domain-containing protein [Pseudomonadota bacterium]